MAQKIKFESSLKIMRISLLVSGIKTTSKSWNPAVDFFVNSCLFHLNFITLYSVIIAEIAWLIQGINTGRSFIEMTLVLPLIAISCLGTVKFAFLYLNRDVVCEIIDALKEIHPEENEEASDINRGLLKKNDKGIEDTQNIEEKITIEAVTVLKLVSNLLIVVSGSVLVMFLLAPLILMIFEYHATSNMVIMYPFTVEYWFDVYDTSLWPVLYLHQVIATIVVCMNLFGAETLYYVICTYVEMHFRILAHRLKNIKVSRRVKEDLVRNVRKHQQLIYLVDRAELLFTKSALVHIVSSSLLICLSAFNITVTEDVKTLFAFVSFLLLSLSQVSLLCFFGDKLMRSSAEVSDAVYQCPWYDFDASTRKAVLIIIMRAWKPCKLTAANFADLNLRAFTTILSRSWSYFALLKTVYK